MVLLGKLAEGRFDDAALQMKHQVQVRLFLDSVVGERGRPSSSCLPAKSVVVGQVGFSLFLFYFDILNSVSELDLNVMVFAHQGLQKDRHLCLCWGYLLCGLVEKKTVF